MEDDAVTVFVVEDSNAMLLQTLTFVCVEGKVVRLRLTVFSSAAEVVFAMGHNFCLLRHG